MFYRYLLLLIIFDFIQQFIVGTATAITTNTWNCSFINREPFSLFYREHKINNDNNEYLENQCQITIDYDSDNKWNRCDKLWINNNNNNNNKKSINLNQIIVNLIQTTNIKLKRIIAIKLFSCSINNMDDLLLINKRNYIKNLISTIEYLDLTHNNIRKLSSLSLFPQLKYLYLDYNHIEQDDSIDSKNMNNNLISLSLRGNKNLVFTNSQFFSFYSKLTMLDISDCNLKLLPKTLFENLTKLNYLSLKNNFLDHLPILPDKLDYLDLSYNKFNHIDLIILKLNNLHTLHLKYNQIRSLEFLKYHQQQHSNEHINNTIDQDNNVYSHYLRLSLHGNPLLCDCWMTNFYDNYYGGDSGNELDNNKPYQNQIIISDLEILKCQLILPYNNNKISSILTYKLFSELEKSDLLCSYDQYCFIDCSCCDFVACDCNNICPNDCSCYHNINWSRNIVNCSQANLTDIPQLLPEKVTELSYESNNIQTIKSYVFVGKTSLLSLNLAHNNLTHFDNNTFCTIPNLEYLDLTHNPIILDNFDIFKCLEHLHVIILSHEQLKNQTNTLLPYPWNIYSTNQYLNLFRLSSNITTLSKRIISLYNFTNQLQINNNVKRERTANKEILTTNPFVAYSSSIVNQNLTTISNNSDRKRLSQPFLYKSYYSPTFDTTKCSDILTTISSINPISFIHQNQTIFFILFFLLILIMTCLILLLCLSYCTRKKLDMKRHHLNIELRSDHPIHHIPQTGDIRMYNTYYKKINQNQNNQDSLYEQLPSSSSDNSERQFLSSKNIYEKYESPPLCCDHHRKFFKQPIPSSCSHHEYQYASFEQDSLSSTQLNSIHHPLQQQQLQQQQPQQQCAILLWANRLFYTIGQQTNRNANDYNQSCPSELHHLQVCLLNNNTKKLDSLNRIRTNNIARYCDNDHLSRKQITQSKIHR